MADTCPHGFTPSECLICATLGKKPDADLEKTSAPRRSARATRASAAQPIPRSVTAVPDAIYEPGDGLLHHRSIAVRLVLLVAALAVAGVAVWLVAAIALAVFRIVELVLVAGGAGWVGYRLGRYRGRHEKR